MYLHKCHCWSGIQVDRWSVSDRHNSLQYSCSAHSAGRHVETNTHLCLDFEKKRIRTNVRVWRKRINNEKMHRFRETRQDVGRKKMSLSGIWQSAVWRRLKRQVRPSSKRKIRSKTTGYKIHTMRNLLPQWAAVTVCCCQVENRPRVIA